MAKAAQPAMEVKIFSPYRVFYQGNGVSVSAINKTGRFDVLYNHANFFTLLLPGQITVNTGYQKLNFPIKSGVLKVSQNHATAFVDI